MSESFLTPIPKGALFTVTSGEYSDYSIHGVFRALNIIDAETLRETYLQDNPEQKENYCFDETKFLTYLTRLGLLEPVDCWELHLCNYSKASEMSVHHEFEVPSP